MFTMPYDKEAGVATVVKTTVNPRELAVKPIGSDYYLAMEVRLGAILELCDKTLAYYREQGLEGQKYTDLPLHDIRGALIGLKDTPISFLMDQKRNTDTAMDVSEIERLVEALSRDTKNYYDHRPCVRADIVCAAMHAAVLDMLSFDNTDQTPILAVKSSEYIREGEVEMLDSDYCKAAEYVGIVDSTSRLARALFTNSLIHRDGGVEEYLDLVESFCYLLGSRMEYKETLEYIEQFFSDNTPYAYSSIMAEAIDVCANYYKGTNVTIFETAKKAYTQVL